MAKTQASQFSALMTAIRKREFSPVYLLMGEEPYYIDRIVEALETHVVKDDEKDFNFTPMYGQEADIAALIAACQQYPFMADRKIVLLKEAQSMTNAKAALDGLAEYVARPVESNVLVVVYKGGDLSATSKLMKAAAKAGSVVFKSPKLRDYQLDGPIKEYCTARRIGIQEKAMVMLKEYLGTSLSKLFGEIDKLIVAGGDKLAQITPELIEQNIGISKDFNNFELQSALAGKEYDRCLKIVKYFASNPKANPTVVTTGTLFTFYSKLVVALLAADKSDAALMAALELKNSYALADYRRAMQRYTARQAVRAVHLLREFDAKSKGINSFQKEYDLLLELIYNIFTAR